jgi:hypothetical protein
MLRALAARPLGLTQLDNLILDLSYPALERRLAGLRQAQLIEPCPNGGRIPYTITEWKRRAGAPTRRRDALGASAPARPDAIAHRIDVEAVFLLLVPLVTLSSNLSDVCRFAASLERHPGARWAGVTIEVEKGRIVACTPRLDGDPPSSATGSVLARLRALLNGDQSRLRMQGRGDLAAHLVAALHDRLHGSLGPR